MKKEIKTFKSKGYFKIVSQNIAYRMRKHEHERNP
jgi:hypothetical protein